MAKFPARDNGTRTIPQRAYNGLQIGSNLRNGPFINYVTRDAAFFRPKFSVPFGTVASRSIFF